MTATAVPPTAASERPYDEGDIGTTHLEKTHRVDLRRTERDVFADARPVDWARLSWSDVGRPYKVENWSAEKLAWEAQNDAEMPIPEAWKHFNRSFQSLFDTDPNKDVTLDLYSVADLKDASAKASRSVRVTVPPGPLPSLTTPPDLETPPRKE